MPPWLRGVKPPDCPLQDEAKPGTRLGHSLASSAGAAARASARARPGPDLAGRLWRGCVERAAPLADGFIFGGGGTRAIDAWKRLRDRVSSLGRPVEGFGADYVALPGGGVYGLVAEAGAWRDTHVSVVTMGLGLDSADGHLDYLASVAGALSLP
jgi:hypothetical protein